MKSGAHKGGIILGYTFGTLTQLIVVGLVAACNYDIIANPTGGGKANEACPSLLRFDELSFTLVPKLALACVGGGYSLTGAACGYAIGLVPGAACGALCYGAESMTQQAFSFFRKKPPVSSPPEVISTKAEKRRRRHG